MTGARENGCSISAVVCTHNRSGSLARCLKALAVQSLPRNRYEVIIVDNASSDDTAPVSAAFCEDHRNFHYVFERRAGVAFARNTGICHSASDIVAFADDDTEPGVTWLEQLLHRFSELPVDVGVVGGDVIPVWEGKRPDWLTDKLLRPLSAGLKWSAEPRILRFGEWLIEGNSAYRKPPLLRCGGFPEHLGRIGDSLLSGEGGVNLLMQRAGHRLYYDPSILARHYIPASRLTRTWFRRRLFWQGVTLNLLHRYVEDAGRQLGLSTPARSTRYWEEITVPLSSSAWAELFDDRSADDFAAQLDQLEGLGYLLESQSVVMGR